MLLSLNAYHYRRGGADAVYFDHAALMEAHGWNNLFYAMHHPQNLPCAQSRWFADEIDYAAARGLGAKLRSAARIIYSAEARAKIAGLLDAHHVDIAHVHNIYHHQSPSVLMELKRRGIPVVLTAHDLKLACPAYKMMNGAGVCERCKGGRVWNVALHRCIKDSLAASTVIMAESAVHKALDLYRRHIDRIVTPSNFYRDKLIEWGWPAEMLVHIPNFAALPPAPESDGSGDYLLYFGRLAPEKGVETLVRAAAMSGVPVRIAGIGPSEASVRDMIATSGAPAEMLGFLSGDALWGAVRRARAIVLPSEWYENGPMSVLEAYNFGKPLIGSRIGGIPEFIEEGVTGWSFTPGSAEDLAARMAVLWAMPAQELAAMGRRCQQFVRDQFGPDRYYQAMRGLYDSLC